MSTYRFRADRLATAAEKKGDHSSYAIAKRTGLSQTAVNRIRQGLSEPTVASLVALATPYDLALDDLIERECLAASAQVGASA
jgi:transcriptional regulator with XRE-family HTH domain